MTVSALHAQIAEASRLFKEQRYDAALAVVNALPVDARFHAAVNSLKFKILYFCGDFDPVTKSSEAERFLDEMIAADPTNPDAWTEKGYLRDIYAPESPEAIGAFDKAAALSLAAFFRAMKGKLSALIAGGDIKKARCEYRELERQFPDHDALFAMCLDLPELDEDDKGNDDRS